MRKIEWLVIHCSASPRDTTTLEDIDRWHRAQGWDGCGYHRVIQGDGTVRQGRHDQKVGSHAQGFNAHSLGICLTGNFDKDVLQEEDDQFKALVQVCAVLCKRHGIPPERIIGHRDTYKLLRKKVAKSCPGNTAYALLPRLRELVAAYLD